MAQDDITIERIKTLHPKIRKKVLDAYLHINNKLLGKGVRLRFAWTFRTPQEQHALFLKKPSVTKADSWQSIHNYGLAFDIVMLYDLDGNGTFETASWDMKKDFDRNGIADWMQVTNYLKSVGFTWGGDWKKFPDNPHFEKNFGLSWQQMKAKIDSKDYDLENGIKYIRI